MIFLRRFCPLPVLSRLVRYVVPCLALVIAHPTKAQQIDFVNADFSVRYNGKMTDGKNHLYIKRQADNYTIDFTLDHWLTSVKQSASFDMKNCQVKPSTYQSTSKRSLSSPTTEQLRFYWEQHVVDYRHNDLQDELQLDHALYDPISFFFEARCQLMAGQTTFSFPVIHKGKPKTHHYRVIGEQTIETGLGTYQSLIIERQRSSKSRKTRLYVAPELDYLLVKIEHQESRLAKIEATLETMDYKIEK